MRVLLVEDDALIGNGLRAGLTALGFATDWFKEGTLGMEALFSATYDAALLDLGLPVLILTARDAISQRVEGLNLGADDYLGKPFDLDEVAARLRALVRRRHGVSSHSLSHGSVSFDPLTRTVSQDGRPVALGQKEVMLVELLLLNRQSVLSKSAIEEKIYPWGEEVSSNSVEVLVHRIRRKLGTDFIKTVHSVGYTLGDA